MLGRSRAALLVVLLVSLPLVANAKDRRLESLSDKYQAWLTRDVVWIITKPEREEFLAASTDAERDRLIDGFWTARDLQPLTKENEFRLEHYKRLEHAKRNLGREASRPGELTDRGRTYILLGKPDDVERVVSANEVYPYEMWFYGRRTVPGFPGQMRILFYRPYGNGEYRLYHPVLDRSRLFPPSSQVDMENISELRNLLGPEVTQAVESVSPGLSDTTSDEVISELKSPKRVPERILERAKALNTQVTTRWTTAPLDLPIATLIQPAPDGGLAVHFGVELPASEVTFTEVSAERFLARIDVFGEVTDGKGVVVASFDEAATLDLDKKSLTGRKDHAFAFQAIRVLVPGKYRVSLVVQDYGVGRLAIAKTVLDLTTPPSGPRLEPFVLAARVDRAEAGASPFAVAGFQLYPRIEPRFQRGPQFYAFALLEGAGQDELEIELLVMRSGETAFRRAAKAPAAERDRRVLLLNVPTENLVPGPYDLRLTVRRGADLVVERTGFFVISEKPVPGVFLYQERRPSVPEVEHYNRAIQLLSAGDLAEAETHFRVALGHRETFKPALVYLARTLILRGKSDDAAPLLEKVLTADPGYFDALVTRGTLLLTKSDWIGATQSLEAALAAGPRSAELLNGLAEAASGRRDATAEAAWLKESLELNPEQPAIRARLKSLEEP